MPKFRQISPLDNTPTGWSAWIKPIMSGYRLGCCDCRLVHDLEFMAVKITKKNPNGTLEFHDLDPEKFQVQFRARRNNRSTSQIRRHQGVKFREVTP